MLGFRQAVKLCHARGASFNGRSSRSEFWWPALIVLCFLFLFVLPLGAEHDGRPGQSWPALLFGAMLVFFFVLMPVIVRRFHDRGLSGWLLLLLFLVGAGILVNENGVSHEPALLFFAAIFVPLALPGKAGPNKYGDDPLSPGVYEGLLKEAARKKTELQKQHAAAGILTGIGVFFSMWMLVRMAKKKKF